MCHCSINWGYSLLISDACASKSTWRLGHNWVSNWIWPVLSWNILAFPWSHCQVIATHFCRWENWNSDLDVSPQPSLSNNVFCIFCFQNNVVQNKTSIFKCHITSLYNPLVTNAVPEGGRRHPEQNIVIFIKWELEKGLGNNPKGSYTTTASPNWSKFSKVVIIRFINIHWNAKQNKKYSSYLGLVSARKTGSLQLFCCCFILVGIRRNFRRGCTSDSPAPFTDS